MKAPKTAVVRARCEEELKRSIDEIARIQKIDPSDIIRIALESYVARIQSAFRGQRMALGM